MEIKSSIILVTSAGSQLGGTIANHLVNLGATVILCDIDSASLDETYQVCSRYSTSVYSYPIERYDSQTIVKVLTSFSLHLVRLQMY